MEEDGGGVGDIIHGGERRFCYDICGDVGGSKLKMALEENRW